MDAGWPGWTWKKHLEIEGHGDSNCSQILWLPKGKFKFHKATNSKVPFPLLRKSSQEVLNVATPEVTNWPVVTCLGVVFGQHSISKIWTGISLVRAICFFLHCNPSLSFFPQNQPVFSLKVVCLARKVTGTFCTCLFIVSVSPSKEWKHVGQKGGPLSPGRRKNTRLRMWKCAVQVSVLLSGTSHSEVLGLNLF